MESNLAENLPQGWRLLPLSQIATIYNGNSINKTVKQQKYTGLLHGRNYIGTKDIGWDGNVCYENGVKIPFSEEGFKTAPAGSVFVCSEGGSAGKKTAYITQEVCFGNKLYAITNTKNLFDGKYIYYYTKYYQFLRQFKSLLSGIIGGVSSRNFGKINIPLPPLLEQARIVARIEELFSQLDAGIETLKKLKAQLALYRQSILKEAFDNFRNGELGILSDYIENKPRNGLSPKPVSYVTNYKNLTLTSTTSGYFKEDCYKYVDINIDADSYLWVKNGDVLIQRGNTIDYVGTAAQYLGEDNVYIYPDLMMKFHIKEGILSKFVLYQLQYQRLKGYYRSRATGTAGSMPKINQETVCNTPIVMTSFNEQKKVAQYIDYSFSCCDKIEETVETALREAEVLRQGILKRAFEGNL